MLDHHEIAQWTTFSSAVAPLNIRPTLSSSYVSTSLPETPLQQQGDAQGVISIRPPSSAANQPIWNLGLPLDDVSQFRTTWRVKFARDSTIHVSRLLGIVDPSHVRGLVLDQSVGSAIQFNNDGVLTSTGVIPTFTFYGGVISNQTPGGLTFYEESDWVVITMDFLGLGSPIPVTINGTFVGNLNAVASLSPSRTVSQYSTTEVTSGTLYVDYIYWKTIRVSAVVV